MRFLRTLTIPGLIYFFAYGLYASDKAISTRDGIIDRHGFYAGIDLYYRTCCDYPTGPSNFEAIEKCKMSLMTRAVEGEFFEPREFWQQSMDDQLKFFKDEIISCNLLKVVKEHYDSPGISYTVAHFGKPYKIEEEMAFREAVWPKIQKFVNDNHLEALSKENFYASLMININPPNPWKDAPADAPLIRHFARYLCPLWGKLPGENLKPYPSWFEQFILEPKED